MNDSNAGSPCPNILVVDDLPDNLRLLSQMLSEHGYKVRAVTGGPRALSAVRTSLPDLILLDIRMPHMDGYAVCEELKAAALTRDIPVIFISALDEVQDKVRAFTAGGVDYITKPFQVEEVLARVGTHLALRELQKQLQEANARLAGELALAGKLQAGILPRRLPEMEGWQLAATLQPARETSGDFYDVGRLPAGQLTILIADVADKGAGAALYMALCCTLFRTYAAEFPGQPERVLKAVNHRLRTDIECDEFVTAFYGILDPASGSLLYCNAGHNPPYLIKPGLRPELHSLPRTGMALGVDEDARWEQRAIRLAPGDLLLLYTDGLTDAENSRGEPFGVQRLLQAIPGSPSLLYSPLEPRQFQVLPNVTAKAILATLLAEFQEFVGQAPQHDDLALLVVTRQASPQ